MPPTSAQRGEMSQDSLMPQVHRTNVARASARPARTTIDPAAKTGRRAYSALSASSVGLELGLSVVLGLLVGYYLDQRWGTTPWMMLLWLGLGLVAGFRGVIRAINRADRAAVNEAAEASRG